MSEPRLYRWAFFGLIALNLLWVWILPIFPAQDLPQHLAYVRILMDYGRADLPFASTYALPEHFQPYYTVYYVLAGIGRWTSLLTALKVLLSLYVVAVFFSFEALVRAVHPDRSGGPLWTGLLGALLVWNPIFAIGFLAFALCVPIFFWGAAALFRLGGPAPRRADWLWLLASAVALSSVHVVAAGALLLLVVLHAAFVRTFRGALSALGTFLVVGACLALFGLGGETGLAPTLPVDFAEAFREGHGLDFLTTALHINWGDNLQRLHFILWAALGPYRSWGLALMAAGASALAFAARKQPSGPGISSVVLRSVFAFGAISFVLPHGFYAPTEIMFLGFRLLVLAVALAIALIPPARFTQRAVAEGLVAFCAMAGLHFGYRASAFVQEAAPVLELLKLAEPKGMLAPVSFHEHSDHFGKQFHLTHFLPMYYTVNQGGVSTQFWARYTKHLPIAYLPGKDPPKPPDLSPHLLEAKHLEGADWYLVELAREEDPLKNKHGSAVALQLFEEHGTQERCYAGWCLFRADKASP